MNADDVTAMLTDVDEIYSMKGRKVHHLNLKTENPSQEEVLSLLLGPTGNLRAPALRKGRTLIVGFNADTYASVFR